MAVSDETTANVDLAYGVFSVRRQGVPKGCKLSGHHLHWALEDACNDAINTHSRTGSDVEIREVYVSIGDVVAPDTESGLMPDVEIVQYPDNVRRKLEEIYSRRRKRRAGQTSD